MNTTTLVSVLMTAYNREKYIAEAIESVLASTYTNFELIIVDDCSTDHTVEIAQSYEAKDRRIRVYVNETNLGDYPNRNKASEYAKGKYIKYVDADDLIYPWGLELLAEMMEQFPKAGLGLCSLIQDKGRKYPFQLSSQEAYHYHYFEKSIFHKAPLSSIINLEAFNAVGKFSGKRMYGDFEMWHTISAKFPLVLMPDGIVWSREHGEQEMFYYENFLMGYHNVTENSLLDHNCPLDKKERVVILKKIKKSKSILILKSFIKMRFRLSKIYLNESGYSLFKCVIILIRNYVV